jgi:site-specific DNA-methyltransferase (adenine-specific)
MSVDTQVQQGDCLDLLQQIPDESIDLIYMDPPFFTGKVHRLKTRDRTREFSYDDLWRGHKKYTWFLSQRITEMKRVLKKTGSIFVHCDNNATHIIRALLNNVFGLNQFRSEIIWFYRRWSNAKKGLLPAHQTVYFYSRSDQYKFHTIYNDYSESTNIDQILQKRVRDKHGKAVYARDEDREIILDDEKEGVPLSDVWDIPYLNPKARERVGYPTQKPILLLERIIKIDTDPDDTVLDPFCGSGTTLVAAQFLERNSIGMDISEDAVELTKARLKQPLKSDSRLIQKGRNTYLTADEEAISLLRGLDLIPVQRNKCIDAILKRHYKGTPVLVRVQKRGEPLSDAAALLSNAAKKRGAHKAILVRTEHNSLFPEEIALDNVLVLNSTAMAIQESLTDLSDLAHEALDEYQRGETESLDVESH